MEQQLLNILWEKLDFYSKELGTLEMMETAWSDEQLERAAELDGLISQLFVAIRKANDMQTSLDEPEFFKALNNLFDLE